MYFKYVLQIFVLSSLYSRSIVVMVLGSILEADQQTLLATMVDNQVTNPKKPRKAPSCKKCKRPMKGHSKENCGNPAVN